VSLVDRVKGLRGPSREVDALIEIEVRRFEAYKVGLNDAQRAHWKPVGRNGEVHEGGSRYHAPEYTRSIDAGIAACQKFFPLGSGWNYTMAAAYGSFSIIPNDPESTGIHDPRCGHGYATVTWIPLAIVEALLLALENNLSHPDLSKGGEE
jgi:hypothetical protein